MQLDYAGFTRAFAVSPFQFKTCFPESRVVERVVQADDRSNVVFAEIRKNTKKGFAELDGVLYERQNPASAIIP